MASTPTALAADAHDDGQPSYIDYETFLSPEFAPAAFANSLVTATNNPSDCLLDLFTPLSRVLFDAQELDSHIHQLTTRSALPLLQHTRAQTDASGRIITELDAQVKSLNDSYAQLEKEVIDKHAEADEVRGVALRLWDALRLARSVARFLQLGLQLDMQYIELGSAPGAPEDHGALTRCSYTILSLWELLDSRAPGEEGHGLTKIDAVRSLQDVVLAPTERSVCETAEAIIRRFSIHASMTFAQVEETRTRVESALSTLYLLSPTAGVKPDRWTPRLLLQALETLARSALQTSVTSLSRSLSQLPSLDRALAEVTAKCQNLVALELILESVKPPAHPLLPPSAGQKHANLNQPLLAHLETGSLASWFWRTMAGSLASCAQEIVSRPGVVAWALKANKNSVGDAIRQAVIKGSLPPPALIRGKNKGRFADANWDREIAVMIGSVANHLGR